MCNDECYVATLVIAGIAILGALFGISKIHIVPIKTQVWSIIEHPDDSVSLGLVEKNSYVLKFTSAL